MEEVWKDIAGWEGVYMVSDMGRVKSFKKGGEKILKPVIRSGYPCVTFSKGPKYFHFTIHRLVMSQFEGPSPEECPEIDHLNGNKLDARRVNLQYVSSSENKKRAYALGLADRKGEKHQFSKLNNEQVLSIFNSNLTCTELSALYKVNHNQITAIKRGQAWAHVTGGIYKPKNVRKLTVEEVMKIKSMPGTYREIANVFAVAHSVVQNIKNGKSHKQVLK